MKVKELKLASVSDIHLGHSRNDTAFIIANLDAAFPDNAETADLDMIVLVGDVFDGLLSLPDNVITDIDYWMMRLLRLCKKHDIVLRVLEGTPSHDWKQSRRFEIWNVGAQIGADLKYVDTMSIEHNERFGITILYIPDEWRDTTEETLQLARDLIVFNGLEKVDFVFMHGQFEYQLPAVVKAPKHDSDAFLGLCRYLIFIGHVHLFSRLERIIAQGSFDRLSHGEEGPKGHVRAVVRGEDDYDIEFRVNVGARKFVTVDCQGLDVEEALDQIEHVIVEQEIPDHSFMRISCSDGHPLLNSMDLLSRRWPMITWSKLAKSVEQERLELTDSELADESFVPIQITPDNIVDLTIERLRRRNVTDETIRLAKHALAELK